jgi:hypothetical protein
MQAQYNTEYGTVEVTGLTIFHSPKAVLAMIGKTK